MENSEISHHQSLWVFSQLTPTGWLLAFKRYQYPAQNPGSCPETPLPGGAGRSRSFMLQEQG